MVADAVARCLSHAIDKIDLDHPNCNPFSYLTQTCYNVFRQKINKIQLKFQENCAILMMAKQEIQ